MAKRVGTNGRRARCSNHTGSWHGMEPFGPLRCNARDGHLRISGVKRLSLLTFFGAVCVKVVVACTVTRLLCIGSLIPRFFRGLDRPSLANTSFGFLVTNAQDFVPWPAHTPRAV